MSQTDSPWYQAEIKQSTTTLPQGTPVLVRRVNSSTFALLAFTPKPESKKVEGQLTTAQAIRYVRTKRHKKTNRPLPATRKQLSHFAA